MMTRRAAWTICALLCGLWICANAQAVSVRAWLDRTSMQIGETVTLNVEVNGDTHAPQPDFSALQKDFNLLGTQSSTSLNIVNGHSSSKLLWAVALQPKHTGKLTVPALTVDGKTTQPIALAVSDSVPGSGKPGGDLYIETLLEPHEPYVQQQIRLTVKLYYAVNLTDGNLDDPHADGLVVSKLGKDSNYRAVVGGKPYRVVERHYSLLPEKSGKLTLPSIQFRGHVLDARTIDLFMNNGRLVTAHSNPISIDVRPRPANSGDGVWLPARSVTLTEDGIDNTATARVGNPITLTLHLKAQGLGFEQLPRLKLPDIDGADVYPDKTTTSNRNDGEWIYGERVRKFAIVPNRPGKLTLPAIRVDWWDTARNLPATAKIPAQTIDVLPAAAATTAGTGSAATQPAGFSAAAKHAPLQAMPNATVAKTVVNAGRADSVLSWRMLAIAIAVLWLLTLLAWGGWAWRSRQRVEAVSIRDEPETRTGPVARQFSDACKREDWATAARSLLQWARTMRPGMRNLGELASVLDDSTQVETLRDLERARYGGDDGAGLAGRLASAFAKGPKMKTAGVATKSSALPPLYPFRTRA